VKDCLSCHGPNLRGLISRTGQQIGRRHEIKRPCARSRMNDYIEPHLIYDIEHVLRTRSQTQTWFSYLLVFATRALQLSKTLLASSSFPNMNLRVTKSLVLTSSEFSSPVKFEGNLTTDCSKVCGNQNSLESLE
jgi:hypothetical protein